MNNYIGHPMQISGVEEVCLSKGKGKGMTLLQIRNGKGIDITLSADRCMDISRLSFKGDNMGYFAPCGYVAPAFYDDKDAGFLKSFTAGFLTTCGITAVGSPCTDDGENLPLHGTISNTPCDSFNHFETENELVVEAIIRDARLFGNQLLLRRRYTFSKISNTIRINDVVENIGSKLAPCMLLYHFNMGYPLLSENAVVKIPADNVTPRDEHAADDVQNALVMEKPQRDYRERCYFYDIKEKDGVGKVGIYNPDIHKGLIMSFKKDTLDFFTEWKMMGEKEYVLGLEPANCTPDGRDIMRKAGALKELKPGEKYQTEIEIEFTEREEELRCL